MENADYHAHPAISKSHLDLIARSPLHYWARFLDPKRVIPEPTPAMRIGSAVHTHVLELDKWDTEYTVAPDGLDRRTKAGKEAWAAFEAESANGRTVLSRDGCRSGHAHGQRDARPSGGGIATRHQR
jgi:exodeoxyribonuclease VIII